jgi:exonuclease III
MGANLKDICSDIDALNLQNEYNVIDYDSDYDIDSTNGFECTASNYILEEDVHDFFDSKLDVKKNCLNLMHINCRSLNANFSKIENFLTISNVVFSAIAVTETWLNNNNQDIFQIDGYNFFSKNRSNLKTGGGVGLYVNNKFDVELRNDLSVSNDIIECIFLELVQKQCVKSRNVLIGCIYRPPSGDIGQFTNALVQIVTTANKNKKYKMSVLAGDFNIDLIKSSCHSATQDFADSLFSHCYMPVINKPTRIACPSATLIDNFFIDSLAHNVTSAIVYNDISDHFPIVMQIGMPMISNSNNDVSQCRLFTPELINKFKAELTCIDWKEYLDQLYCNDADPNEAYSKFLEIYSGLYSKHFPLKPKLSSRLKPRQEWITPGLIRCCRTKSKLYKKYKLHPTTFNEMSYKKYRNKLKSILLIAERTYYTNKIKSCSGNIKQVWKVLNLILGKRKICPIAFDFMLEGEHLTDPKIIVSKFNDFFTNIGKNLANKIPPTSIQFSSFLDGSFKDTFLLFPTDASEVISVAKLLPCKKSAGYDDISVEVMVKTIDHIAEPLAEIINLSFSAGKVPDLLKIAKVCPIHKDGAKNDFSNYRPISLLPSFSKIFEKLVFIRLVKYLDKMNILSPSQYGFRAHHSTSMALLDLYDKISLAIDDKKYAVGIFIDLQKRLIQLTTTSC